MDTTLLEEFKSLVGLYSSYLTLLLGTFSMAMTVAGGVIAYLVKGEGETRSRQRGYALLLPATLCVGLGGGFAMQHTPATQLRDRLIELADRLNFGLPPHGDILVNAVAGLSALLLVVGFVLLGVALLEIWQNVTPPPVKV